MQCFSRYKTITRLSEDLGVTVFDALLNNLDSEAQEFFLKVYETAYEEGYRQALRDRGFKEPNIVPSPGPRIRRPFEPKLEDGQDPLDLPITALNLEKRVYTHLFRQGINTIRDIVHYGRYLDDIRQIGDKTIEEIAEKLLVINIRI